MFVYWNEQSLLTAVTRGWQPQRVTGNVWQRWRLLLSPPPPAHPLSVRTPAQWCEGIVVVIAFKTGLGSRPRIFQLWSVKPITYLLREDTQSCVDESPSVRANLWHLLWHHHIPSVLKYSVRLLFCGSLALQKRVDNAMNSEVSDCQYQLVVAVVLQGWLCET